MRVFICYSRKDESFVGRLTRDLRKREVPIWRDIDDIPGNVASNTAGWRTAVDAALRDCTHMIVVLSPDSVASPEVASEWNYFLSQGRPVIPVLYRDCQIPYRLYSLNYWDLRDTYKEGLEKLIAALPTRQSDIGATLPHQHQRLNKSRKSAPVKVRRGQARARTWWIVGGAVVALALVVWLAVAASIVQGWGQTPGGETGGTATDGGATSGDGTTGGRDGGDSGGTDGGSSGSDGGSDGGDPDRDAAITAAVVAFDRAMRKALETGDITDLSSTARGKALQDRLNAVEILRDAGNCHWVYDQRGLSVESITMMSDAAAEALAKVDRDGRVFCSDGERPQYAFTGPYDATYTVEFLDGRWLVTDYSPNTDE